jgi:hypothetical protein
MQYAVISGPPLVQSLGSKDSTAGTYHIIASLQQKVVLMALKDVHLRHPTCDWLGNIVTCLFGRTCGCAVSRANDNIAAWYGPFLGGFIFVIRLSNGQCHGATS